MSVSALRIVRQPVQLALELRADVLADVGVCWIMGWTKLDMALHYASLRGEDLASRMG